MKLHMTITLEVYRDCNLYKTQGKKRKNEALLVKILYREQVYFTFAGEENP